MNLNDIYSQMITEYSASTENRGHLKHSSVTQRGVNPSCGDEIELELLVENGVIKDASFTGDGCAISQASAAMMLELIKGKSIEEAKETAALFRSMIRREVVEDAQLDELGPAVALKNVSTMPSRAKCATMPWHTLQMAAVKTEND